MKCIKRLPTPEANSEKMLVVRVADKTARKLVKKGWNYCPKSEWKANNRQRGV